MKEADINRNITYFGGMLMEINTGRPIDLVNNYNDYYGRLNPANQTTPLLHLKRQVEPEIIIKDTASISFAAQERARWHSHQADLRKFSAKVTAERKAHAEHFKA